jgi:hypothetical protein
MTEDIENTLKIKNGQAVSLSKIPVLEYQEFYALVLDLLQDGRCPLRELLCLST